MISERARAVQAYLRHLTTCARCRELAIELAVCTEGLDLGQAIADAKPPEGGPFFCGFCLRWIDGHGTCGDCDWVWLDLMTEPEARAYRAGWEAESDDDAREASAVAALETFRARHGG